MGGGGGGWTATETDDNIPAAAGPFGPRPVPRRSGVRDVTGAAKHGARTAGAAVHMIDLHNHLIPGVDDGAASADDACAGISAMHGQGFTAAVCTPHVSGALTRDPAALAARLAELDAGWDVLRAAAADGPDFALHRGAEVMLDTPEPDLSDARLRMAGTRFVLVEFPFMAVPPNAAAALFELRMKGWEPLLAHPERYANAASDLSDAAEWRRVGARLQVNAGSLAGRYGDRPHRLAWKLLEEGMADYVASDFHTRGRVHTADAAAEMDRRGGREARLLLTETNPARLLSGESPLAVPPVPRPRRGWRRLLGGG